MAEVVDDTAFRVDAVFYEGVDSMSELKILKVADKHDIANGEVKKRAESIVNRIYSQTDKIPIVYDYFQLLRDLGCLTSENVDFLSEKERLKLADLTGTPPKGGFIKDKESVEEDEPYWKNLIIDFTDVPDFDQTKTKYLVSSNWAGYSNGERTHLWNFLSWILDKAIEKGKITSADKQEIADLYTKLTNEEKQKREEEPSTDNESIPNAFEVVSEKKEAIHEISTNRHPDRIHYGTNLIIYGAPGTGKSHWVEENYGKENLTRVVFHPEYTYFDFVGQYRPCPVYEKDSPRKFAKASDAEPDVVDVVGEPFIDYRFVPGPFTDVLVKAWKEKKANEESPAMYTLLIEELNRADAAAVFGDVFQLLDRDSNGKSEYGIVPSEEWGAYLKSAEVTLPEGKVEIPSNMNIIATMNSADQGVHMLDTAFKRRWDYHFMSIDEGLNSEELKDIKVRYAGTDIGWKQFITILNEKLADDFQIPEDRLIGPFFVKPKIVKEDSEKAIKKILFYLWDDVLRNSSGRNQFFKGITTMSQLYKDFDKGEDVMGIKDKLGSNTENSGQA